ncbi:unnamed protein product [Cyprideis torosa]|uniref:Uncharacterized protein n=1 Tax=Cyprideis torosa TaxID=163714 RepID=A0A7R8WGB2_9CRUS|nr:unnamed protein product [Cyprideis torosa]CAG0897873.1 unnamed protein product [Cyprideis torosa]
MFISPRVFLWQNSPEIQFFLKVEATDTDEGSVLTYSILKFQGGKDYFAIDPMDGTITNALVRTDELTGGVGL